MGDLSDFERGQTVVERLAGASVTKTASHFMRCIQNSSFQGCDGIHKSWEDIISWEEQWPKSKWRGSPYFGEDFVSKPQNHCSKAELNNHLEDPVSSQIVQRELHKSNIHGTAAIAKPLPT